MDSCKAQEQSWLSGTMYTSGSVAWCLSRALLSPMNQPLFQTLFYGKKIGEKIPSHTCLDLQNLFSVPP